MIEAHGLASRFRSNDQQGRRASRHGQRSLLPRAPASAARVHQPRPRRRRPDGAGTRALGLSGDRGTVVQAHSIDHRCASRRAAPARYGVFAGRRSRAVRDGSDPRRAAHGASPDVDRRGTCRTRTACVRRAVLRATAATARKGVGPRAPRRHHVREQADAHDEAAREPSVRAHGRAGAMHSRDLRRHVQRPPDAALLKATSAAGNDCRAVCRAARDGERLQAAVMAPTELSPSNMFER